MISFRILIIIYNNVNLPCAILVCRAWCFTVCSWVESSFFFHAGPRFPPAQPVPSIKLKCTSSHLGQKRLCKPNKDTSQWEINSHGPLLCNLFLSPGRMNSLPDHLSHRSRKPESLQLLKETEDGASTSFVWAVSRRSSDWSLGVRLVNKQSWCLSLFVINIKHVLRNKETHVVVSSIQ